MLSIKELIRELKENEIAEEMECVVENYSERETDLYSVLDEVSDNATSIYNYDLYLWALENPRAVEKELDDYGWNPESDTLADTIQGAQYTKTYDSIQAYLYDLVMYIGLKKLQREGYSKLTQDQYLDLTNELSSIDTSVTIKGIEEGFLDIVSY